MNPNNILPPDFDGVFRFTNFSEEEFRARWNGIEYTFPALKTIPLIVSGETLEGVQYIRKKFAKELALREFQKTDKFKQMNNVSPGGVPALYTDSDLEAFIQKCLEPLPLAQVAMRVLPKDSEKNYKKDTKGRNVTKVLDKDDSLVGDGTQME